MKDKQTITQFLGIKVDKNNPFVINNADGKELYFEDYTGSWINRQYDERGNQVHVKTSSGFWAKRTFIENDQMVRYEDSYNNWYNYAYDAKGYRVFEENNAGVLYDRRPKIELTIREIADKLGVSVELLRIKE